MKKRIIRSKVLAAILLGTVITSSVLNMQPVKVMAEEAVAEGEAVDPAAAEGAVEGEVPVEGEGADMGLEDGSVDTYSTGAVTPGTILANNGLYIANTFPDSLMPAGFHRQTVAYQGQNIDLAYMDASDMVVLAYLTDATGAIGDFYLCDTATATMSDYVRLEGGNGTFLIILDPGDNINAPTGFNKTVANINNKTVTAWSLPDGSSSSKDKDKDKDKEDKEASNPFVLRVYGADLGLGIGAGSTDPAQGTDAGAVTDGTADAAAPVDPAGGDGTATVVDNSYTDGTAVDPAVAAAQAAEAAAASVVTDAAGFVKAQPSEFYLIYGVDYNGAQGFFLYDTFGQTYQRYVEIDYGENEETLKFKKSAQIRLFIICGLILFAVVLIFIIVNMSLGGKKGGSRRYEDGDDDVEAVKRRVKTKERRSIANNNGRRYIAEDDYEDDYEDADEADDFGQARGYQGGNGRYGQNGSGFEEEEDVRYYDRQSQHTGRGVVRNGQGPAPQRKGVRTESRPKVRTERRYVPSPEEQMYNGVGDETGDMSWQGGDQGMGGYRDGGSYGNDNYGNQRMKQDIDLDDDFNFDFIKPGK